MAMSQDNLMISDRVWILVGMLLRNGQSCTPSELSDLCHRLAFASSEIQWLCKLPFSPLCLSQCGQVTFSQFVFHSFNFAKDRYAAPSINLAAWKSYLDSSSTSSLIFPLLLSQRLYQPSMLYASLNKQPSSGKNLCRTYPQQIAGGEGVQKPGNSSSAQICKKRLRSITYTPSNKKLKISSVGVKETSLYVPDGRQSSLMQSTAGEAEESCILSISLDAKHFFEVPIKLEARQQALALTESASSYSQQSWNASVTYLGDHMAEIDMSINLPLDREGSMPDITKDRGREPVIVTNEAGRSGSHGKLETLVDKANSYHNSIMSKARNVPSPLNNPVNVLNGEGGQKVNSQLPETHPELVENTYTFLQNSSDNLIGDIVRVPDVSPHESDPTTYLKKQHGQPLEANQRHDRAESDLNMSIGADPVGRKLSKQHKGKAVKDPHHKNLTLKQVPKVGKLKRASGPKKQLHTAGCSAVVEACSDQLVEDKHPSFDGFIVEAVEGSGGYGTVYKAMKKDGGKLVAIKYPYERTSFKHVQNEIKFLQKYGGQNFIPKCLEVIEESGKQCLVLDYVEHEKPEILKKEISIFELQFYGFSLFKALEYLHSKGVIHRDVKPGNFLFSRNKKCGWLVDFNLATVQTKQSNSGKYRKQVEGRLLDRVQKDSESHQRTVATLFNANKNSSPHHQSSSLGQASKGKMKHVEAIHQERIATLSGTPTRDLKVCSQGIRSPTLSQSRKHTECTAQHDWYKLQTTESGLDVSVHAFPRLPAGRLSPANVKVPALKETATVTKKSRPNSSTHRSPLKEQGRVLKNVDTQKGEQVLPRYGRRELWELVQKSQHSTQPPVSAIPSSQKKRVAAPQKRKHQKSFLDQSLPQSSALPVSKISFCKTSTPGHLLKARGTPKVRKEGPCAGTKGYRAPEVLLKSLFQTEKIDIWSAGVSLFQLILGKSPFSSSSNLDQSLLDIAQFGGADAICTLAKEHNRQSSLSKELTALKVQPMSVRLWCEQNTKKQNILPLIPCCLFDLLEKCLQIDPKNRISAKEALQHEFFNSCRNSVPLLTSSM